MTNIPTDLLRTFVLVVEMRSFTRAAKAQGMTQPAVSAQIRRLQFLLGVDLFDKSAPGISLTPMGEQVIDAARRLLSVNDHIVEIANPDATTQLVRIGLRKDCMGEELAEILAASRAQWPNLRFKVFGAGQRLLLQHLKQDQIDLVVALVAEAPDAAARHHWAEDLAWVRGRAMALDLKRPVPLISYGDRCVCHRAAMTTLNKAGLTGELVFRANTAEALRSAVAAGYWHHAHAAQPYPRRTGDLGRWSAAGGVSRLWRCFCPGRRRKRHARPDRRPVCGSSAPGRDRVACRALWIAAGRGDEGGTPHGLTEFTCRPV
jgi:DNA-binding transcriptional LysR family regulator